MRRTPIAALTLGATLFIGFNAQARRAPSEQSRQLVPLVSTGNDGRSFDRNLDGLFSHAAAGTTVLGSWTFDVGGACDAQGWTSHDITAQTGDYFHVDDFAGLGGGTYGGLFALSGLQSMWCGARPSSSVILCGYQALPGYGNLWNQALCTIACLAVTGDVDVNFRTSWDSEPGYDFTTLEADDGCTGDYVGFDGGVGVWDGAFTDTTITSTLPDSLHSGTVRLRFHFTSDGAWSDEDGLWNTDGAFIIDDLSVSDAGGTVLSNEDFEGESVGDNDATDWETCTPPGYGDYAALYPGLTLVLEDPCFIDFTCMWTFYTGSTENYGCGGFPFQTAMPKGNADGQYLSNEIWSPLLPYVGTGVDVQFSFRYYRDLPLINLQFLVWHIRSFVAGCPSNWEDLNFVYFGGQKDWLLQTVAVGGLIQSGASDIQLVLGAVDACGFWCGIYGNGACHSHAPLIDDVTLLRIDAAGPQWLVRDIDLFQDNFSDDGTVTGTARADMATDILPGTNPGILPGDSVCVEVSDPEWGLSGPPLLYVAVWPQGQPGKGAAGIESKDQTMLDSVTVVTRWPVVDSLTHDGVKWYCIRMDTAYTNGFSRTGPQPNRFCVDLCDSVFTPCDTICFVFCASNTNGDDTYWSPFTGSTTSLWEALNQPAEFQILPGGGWKRGGDILYVDGMNARGAQPFFDTTFDMMGMLDEVDRYDIRGPSSSVGNRPGSRVKNVQNQIIGCYRKIIWNTGDLSNGTIGDGTGNPEKSNDAYLLNTFLDLLPNTGGVYLSGDDLAEEWATLTGLEALNLRNFITHNVTNSNHVAWGASISPNVTGVVGGCFDHILGPDVIVAYGGCPLINDFDVLEPTGTAQSEMQYPGGGVAGSAVISQVTLNTAGFNVGVILSGFSFHYIRDAVPAPILARTHHLGDILNWLDNSYSFGLVDADSPNSYTLSQNHPNPFNPVTMIDYVVAARGQVTLRIYNVAGQLVRTLVDETAVAGAYAIEWDGRDDAGVRVSSGVYFYKLVSGDFSATRKMVLLK